jgi:DNA repair exonuclease SbcCD ATPase subunit
MSHDEVLQILSQLNDLNARLARIEAKLNNGLCSDVEDHEARIRDIEVWKAKLYWLPGLLSGIIGGAAGALGAMIVQVITRR